MRDLKVRLFIIWQLLTNSYTKSTKNQCFWIWGYAKSSNILITFDEETYQNRELEETY